MYSLFNPNNRFVFSPKAALSLAALVIVLVLTVAACQTTGNENKTPPAVSRAIVYGKIHYIAVKDNNTQNRYVFAPMGCTDPIQLNAPLSAERLLYDQKAYRMILHRGSSVDSLCIAAAVVYCNNYDSLADATFAASEDFIKGIDSILAGPKKFNLDFHKPPYDSVRVDFFLGDSTGN
jgi:hypothetical protein